MRMKDLHIKLKGSTLQITSQKDTTSDDILTFFRVSKTQRHQLYMEAYLSIDSVTIKRSTKVTASSTLSIQMPTPQQDDMIPYEKELDVIYEDSLLLIVNKPTGLIIHSDGMNQDKTLHNIVKAYYLKQQIQTPVRAIHRLDQDTSGLVLYCKLPFFQPMLDAMLEKKEISRVYLAFVKGIVSKKQMIIEKPIARDRHNAKKMRISPHGKYANTHILRKKQLLDYALVECHLKTGRTHQIRVHLAAIHHPLIADPLYGHKDHRIHRCALHAWKLRLYHPILQQHMEFICEMPKDMLTLLHGT